MDLVPLNLATCRNWKESKFLSQFKLLPIVVVHSWSGLIDWLNIVSISSRIFRQGWQNKTFTRGWWSLSREVTAMTRDLGLHGLIRILTHYNKPGGLRNCSRRGPTRLFFNFNRGIYLIWWSYIYTYYIRNEEINSCNGHICTKEWELY